MLGFSLIQCTICNVRVMFVPSVKDQNRERWRLLVKVCIVNIGEEKKTFFLHFNLFCSFCVIKKKVFCSL